MPDFTNLDPSLIASYWIYFIASFIVGVVLGALASRLFFHREKSAIEQEKKNYEDRLKELEKVEILLAEKDNELKLLKAKVANNELYWNEQKHKVQQPPGDRALYDILHKTDGEKD